MDAPADPGLQGIVPFRFACQRCGHCCSVGEGYVWVEPAEVPQLAQVLSVSSEHFQAHYLRSVADPRTGCVRLALRERAEGSGGRCVLLEGKNHCSAYSARPEHCRSFPYWPAVLHEEQAFERARAVCPGIAPAVPPALKARAFAALEQVYADYAAFQERARPVCLQRGLCCRFEEAGHELYTTALEADYAAAQHPQAAAPEAPGRCPYHVQGKCTARAGRPLGCRTYHCDARTSSVLSAAHEHFLAAIRRIERETGYLAAYGRFPAMLAARGIGSEVPPAPPAP